MRRTAAAAEKVESLFEAVHIWIVQLKLWKGHDNPENVKRLIIIILEFHPRSYLSC